MARKLHPAAELAAYKTEQKKTATEEDLNDRYLRLAAEFDNYKKRTARQFADIVKNANEELVQEILGIVDDFDRALQTAVEKQGAEGDTFFMGMRMIYDKLISLLRGRGVERFESVGQMFDPQYHDAVMQVASEEEEGTVVGVISPGYIMNGRVIRHAKVIVASSK